MSRRPSRAPCLLLALASLPGACREPAGDPRALELVLVEPRTLEGVFLNEELVFHFSREIDRASVNRGSLAIRTSAGRPARGSLRVEGRKVIFRPETPLAADLSDGGYQPGQRYAVELAGFPRPDGLRGSAGEPLLATQLRSFTTVDVDHPRRKLLFDDPHQERAKPLNLFPAAGPSTPYILAPEGAIYLSSDKPIDPSSVRGEDFVLVLAATSGRLETRREHRVPLHARLIENRPEPALSEPPRGVFSAYPPAAWARERRAALVELLPAEPLRPGERGLLSYEPPADPEAHSMRDFSRRPLPLPRGSFARAIEVVSAGGTAALGEFVEEFLEKDRRTPLVVPGCDGTAAWDDSGRVEVHYPLAAGDGSDGELVLGDEELRADVQAIQLDQPAGQRTRLSSQAGLVVLRAQGRITLRGTLLREAPLVEPLDGEAERGVRLSDWLARARAANPSWTVILAGGDLVLEGEIRCGTPLLLCAGGQIRLGALPHAPELPREREGEATLWMQAGAGGVLALARQQRVAQFQFDPPSGQNPLRRPLRYAVVSGPLPETGRVSRWLSASASGWQERNAPVAPGGRPVTPSSWNVRFVPAGESQEPDWEHAVANPVFLERADSVRFLVELVVGDGALWQAPFVDRVQLSYEQAAR